MLIVLATIGKCDSEVYLCPAVQSNHILTSFSVSSHHNAQLCLRGLASRRLW
jgi:hypothetical protein